ncbi:LCP family protein [Patescibacteria group bacterium]
MAKTKINLSPDNNTEKSEPLLKLSKKPWWRRFWLTGGLLAVSLLIIAYSVFGQIGQINSGATNSSLISQLSHLFTSPDRPINGEEQDRINFLLLGIGGTGHQGALLTDTIMVASLKPSTGQIGLLSIPRDLVVEFPTYYGRKINNAIFFGQELDYPGGGEQLSVDMVEQVTDLDIHYYARLDFGGFEQMIDDLGGITVNVDTTFTDYEYPTANFGFQTVSFQAGPQMFIGDQALKYVRSRHGNNGEGSDFARSRRQQKVLQGIKDKALSLGTLANPLKIQKVLAAISAHSKTNMELWEMLRFSKLIKEADTQNIYNLVLDNGTDGLLKTTVGIDGAYLLEPRVGDFSEIHILAANIFNTSPEMDVVENATVAIHNGTFHDGLASNTAEKLDKDGLHIVEIGNALTRDNNETVIYDLTGGNKPDTLNYLKDAIDYARVTSNLPFFLESYNELTYDNINASTNPVLGISTNEVVDFLIILGTDSVSPISSYSSVIYKTQANRT